MANQLGNTGLLGAGNLFVGLGQGFLKGREYGERRQERRSLANQQLLMQQQQLKMQRQRLEISERERKIDSIFKYTNALSKAGASDEQVISELRKLKPITQGFFDIDKVDLSGPGKTKEVVTYMNKLWEQYRKGDIDMQTLARASNEALVRYPKSEKYVKAEIGRVEKKEEGLLDIQERVRKKKEAGITRQQAEEDKIREWIVKGEVEEVSPEGPTLEMKARGAFQVGDKWYVPIKKEGKTKRVWDKQAKEYVQRSQVEINKDPDRYGKTKEEILSERRAGAAQISIGEKAEQKWKADIMSPDLKMSVVSTIKAQNPEWEYEETPQKNKEVRDEIISAYGAVRPNLRFGYNKKTKEWALFDGNTFIRAWR